MRMSTPSWPVPVPPATWRRSCAYAGGGAEEDLQLALVFPLPGLPARRRPEPHHAFPCSCSMLASKAPAFTSSRIPVLLLQACQQGNRLLPHHASSSLMEQPPARFENLGRPPTQVSLARHHASFVLIEQQIQLEDVDHLGPRIPACVDDLTCSVRKRGSARVAWRRDPPEPARHPGQMGIRPEPERVSMAGIGSYPGPWQIRCAGELTPRLLAPLPMVVKSLAEGGSGVVLRPFELLRQRAHRPVAAWHRSAGCRWPARGKTAGPAR